MDLRSMLNEDVDDRRSTSSNPSQTPQSRPTHASTPTGATLNSPYGGPRGSYQAPNEYPFPPTLQQQSSSWSDSRASQTPQRQAATLSPIKPPPPASVSSGYASQYGHPVSTPTSSTTPGHYPGPHPFAPSPSPSSQDAYAHAHHQSSPKLVRSASYQSQPQYPIGPQSYPATPLGPPHSHPGSQPPESHAPNLHHQGSSASSVYHPNQGIKVQSPQQLRPHRQSPTIAYSSQPANHGAPDNRHRDQSASVSPKTVPLQRDLSAPPLQSPQGRPRGTYYHYPAGYTGAKQAQYTSDPASEGKPPSSGTDTINKQTASPTSTRPRSKSGRVEMAQVLSQPPSAAERQAFDPARPPTAVVTPSEAVSKQFPVAQDEPAAEKEDHMKLKAETPPQNIDAPAPASNTMLERPLKRRRIKGPPIWAQPGKDTSAIKHLSSHSSRRPSFSQPQPQAASIVTAPPQPMPMPVQPRHDGSPLGPWEPSITNIQPYNDLTRQVANFLFEHIVQNKTFPTGGAGEVPSQEGQLEIEAKLGRIIDKRTNERIRLPVRNEVVLDNSADVTFESFVNEAQHSAYNAFLNDVVLRSRGLDQQTKRPRIPINYVHTLETDKFYDLPDSEVSSLPPAVQIAISQSPQGRPRRRVRVTHDQKTGQELAKIIKIRIADLHVYSPNTELDWRISVSLESNWSGDIRAITNSTEAAEGSTMERQKNRMSYQHLAFHIDLTQVRGDRQTHELEVELSSAEVRRQGNLVEGGQPQDYELLVQSFMDNIRILARYKK